MTLRFVISYVLNDVQEHAMQFILFNFMEAAGMKQQHKHTLVCYI